MIKKFGLLFKTACTFMSILSLSVTACSGGEPDPTPDPGPDPVDPVTQTYVVTFISNGGSYVPSQTIKDGETVTRPTDPTKEGYTFDAWCKDERLAVSYNFNSPVHESFNLYARWKDAIKYFTVNFIVDGNTYHSERVKENTLVSKPADPYKNDYEFNGWYLSTQYIQEFDFNNPITANLDLFAKFTPIHHHTFSNEWTFDEVYHWHESTCGHDVISEKGEHTFRTQIVNPTFEDQGYTSHICTVCGYHYEDTYVDPLQHTYSEDWKFDPNSHWHVCTDEGYEYLTSDVAEHEFVDNVVEPTFEKEGYTEHTCSVCGYSYKDTTVPAKTHNFAEAYIGNETGHWHVCIDEGYETLTSPVEEHVFVTVHTNATYEAAGFDTHTCSLCGYSYTEENEPKLEHHYAEEWTTTDTHHWHVCTDQGFEDLKGDYGEHNFEVRAVAATFTTEGYVLHTCTDCGYNYKDNYNGPLEHNYSSDWSVDENKGTHYHACTDGEEYTNLRDGEEPHDYEDEVVASTYTAQGYTKHTCKVCGHTYMSDFVDQLQHNYSEEWSHDNYQHWHACTDVGYESEKGSVADHTFTDQIVEPTYEEEGYVLHVCTVCGFSYPGDSIPQKQHTYSEDWTYDTTGHWHACTEEGCTSRQGAESHVFVCETIAPTFSAPGYTKYTCEVCGYTYNSDETPVKEHSYSSNWSSDETHHWHACTDKDFEDLCEDKDVHEFEEGATVPATYDEGGYTILTCKTCDFVKHINETQKLEHNYEQEWTIDEEKGTHYHKCTDEGFKNLRGDESGHIDCTGGIPSDPTFEEDGYILYRCGTCGYEWRCINEGSKLPHNYSPEWTHDEQNHWHACTDGGDYSELKGEESPHDFVAHVVPPTFDDQGYIEHICSTCGYSYTEVNEPKLEHHYAEEWTHDEQNHWHVCIDGDKYSDLRGEESPHDFVETSFPPTFEEDGYTLYRCETCGYEHKEVNENTKKEHCYGGEWIGDENGHYQMCIDEGYPNLHSDYVNHTYGEWVIDEEPTQTQNGRKHHECTVCHYCEYEAIDSIDKQTEGLFTYTLDSSNEYYIITGSTNKATGVTSVTLPSSYNDKPIKKINSIGYYFDSLVSLTIPSSIEEIGGSAFQRAENLETINFSEGLVTIGNSAFRDLTNLQELVFPSTLRTIDLGAFSGCSGLTSVTFNDGLESIKGSSFENCINLTNIVVPDSVTEIGYGTFSGCSGIQSMTLPFVGTGANATYSSTVFGAIFGTSYGEGMTSIYVEGPSFNQNYSIPSALRTVTITGDSLTPSAFYGCNMITTINLTGNIEEIPSKAFYNCNNLSNFDMPDGVTSIGQNAFYCCSELKFIVLPQGLVSIGSGAFNGCAIWEVCNLSSLNVVVGDTGNGYVAQNSIVVIDDPTKRGEFLVVDGMSIYKNTEMNIGIVYAYDDSVIGTGALVIPDYITKIDSGDSMYPSVFTGASFTSVVIPSTLTDLPVGMFENCRNLASILIMSEIEEIPDAMFYNCESLTDFTIPVGVTRIGSSAFSGCTSLEIMNIPEGVTAINSGAFENCSSLMAVSLPSTLPNNSESIGSYAFSECLSLLVVVNGSDVNVQGKYGISDNVTIIDDTGSISLVDDFLLIVRANSKTVLKYLGNATEVVLPDDTTKIAAEAFYGCTSLTEITLPRLLTTVGTDVFNGCTSLEIVRWNAENIASTGSSIFDGAPNITTVYFGAYVETIPAHAFENQVHITHLYWSLIENTEVNSISVIGDYAFAGCTNIDKVIAPNITEIGTYAFSGCSNLAGVNDETGEGIFILPNSLQTLGMYAFGGCSRVTSLTLPFIGQSRSSNDPIYHLGYLFGNTSYEGSYSVDIGYTYYIPTLLVSVTVTDASYISPYSFKDVVRVQNISIGGNALTVGNNAFYGCTSLQTVTIPNTVTTIGSDAFHDCTLLTAVNIPSGVTSIGGNAFTNCSSLLEITLPQGLQSINSTTFNGCSSVQTIYWNAASLTNTSGDMTPFGDLSSLTTVIFGENVQSIFRYAFDGCSSLETVTFLGTNLSTIDSFAFYNCTSLSSISIPNGTTTIGNNVFSGCTSLQSISIPNTVTVLHQGLLSDCIALREITLPLLCSVVELFYGSSNRAMFAIEINNNPVKSPATLTTINATIFSNTIPNRAFAGLANLTTLNFDGEFNAVPDYAFYGLRYITEINIPSTVTLIGAHAFDGCTLLGKTTDSNDGVINISHVTSIGEGAFKGVTGVTEFILCDSLASVGSQAFYGCTSLVEMILPSTVATLGSEAFGACSSLESLTLPSIADHTVGYYFSTSPADGCYSISQYNGTSYPTYYIPQSLVSITILSGEINDYAFDHMRYVTNITLATGCTSIGTAAFRYCSGLVSVSLGGTIATISNHAFAYCESLTSITIPSGIVDIPTSAFDGCTSLSEVNLPNTLTGIGNSAFAGCTSIVSITLPASLELINNASPISGSAFSGCTSILEVVNLSSLEIEVGSDNHGMVAKYAVRVTNDINDKGTLSTVDGYTYFAYTGGKYLIRYTGEETAIVIGNTVTGIASNAFSDLAITTVTIPNSVTYIGQYAFVNCSQLETVNYNANAQVGGQIFSNCPLISTLEIGDDVRTIYDYTFRGLSAISTLLIPTGVTLIEQYAFDGVGATTLIWNAVDCRVIDHYYPSLDSASLRGLDSVTTIRVGSTVTALTVYTFCQIQATNVYWNPTTISNSTHSVFANSIRNVYFGDGVTVVPQNIFKDLSIEYIDFNGITEISEQAFSGNRLVTIVIPSTVTTVGRYAFANNAYLESVTINASVAIGEYAFYGCGGSVESTTSTELNIVGELTSIGNYAFAQSRFDTVNWNTTKSASYMFSGSNVTTVVFGNLVTAVPDAMFSGNTHLTTVTYSSTVTTIGISAFSGCTSLSSITIPATITDIGGNAFGNISTINTIYWNAPNITEYYSGVNPFDKNHITTIVFGSNVTAIPNNAFEGFTHIASITLPNSIVSIGAYAFKDCTSLASITYGNNPSLTTIGDYAFSGCTGFTSTLTIISSVETIGAHAFDGCINVTALTFSDNSHLTTIGEEAFKHLQCVSTVVVPSSVTTIGQGAFACMISLNSITVPFVGGSSTATAASNTTYFAYILTGVWELEDEQDNVLVNIQYSGSSPVTYRIPNSIRVINITGGQLFESCFSKLSMIVEVNLANTITTIPANAFMGCSGLHRFNSNTDYVTNLSNITTIGNHAFDGNSALRSIAFSSQAFTIGEYAFKECTGLVSLVIPNSASSIGYAAFNGCTSLVSVNLPYVGRSANETSAGRETLFGYIFGSYSGQGTYDVAQSYVNYMARSDIYDDHASTFSIPSTLTTVTIRGGKLFYGAFSARKGTTTSADHQGLTSILSITIESLGLTDGHVVIPDYAFHGCNNLQSFTYSGDTAIYSIGAGAFMATGLTAFNYFTEGLNSIGDRAFMMTSLSTVSLPSTLASLGNGAFQSLSTLESVTFAEGIQLTSIGEYAFANTSLESIIIPDSVTAISAYAFYDIDTLTSVTLSSHLQTIATYAFYSCDITGALVIPSSVTTIGYYAFGSNIHMTSVTINSGAIGQNAFKDCTGLATITIGTGVTSIASGENSSFAGVANVTTINYNAINSSGAVLYTGLSSVQTLNIGSSVQSIPNNAFNGFSSVSSVTIPSSVQNIGQYAFANCTGLTTLVIPATVTTIGENAFFGCSNIASITLPVLGTSLAYIFGGTSTLNGYALRTITINSGNIPNNYFKGLTAITSVTLPSTITSIGNNAFDGCTALSKINSDTAGTFNLPAALESIGASAFIGCNAARVIILPSGLETVGDSAFASLTYLTSVGRGTANELFIPNSVVTIGNNSFYLLTSITSIVFESDSHLTTIGEKAFEGMTGITSIEIPSSVQTIGAGALRAMTNLITLTIPFVGPSADAQYYRQIGYLFGTTDYTGAYDTGFIYDGNNASTHQIKYYVPLTLTTVTVIGAVELAKDAFTGMSRLTTINIPNVTSIGDAAFLGCEALTSITIPNSVTSIGKGVFDNCKSLTEIVVPFFGSSLSATTNRTMTYLFNVGTGYAYSQLSDRTNMYLNSFDSTYYPSSLVTVTVRGGALDANAFRGITSLTRINIPDTLTYIPDDAFHGCSALMGLNNASILVIPSAVQTIGANAFEGCGAARTLTISASVVNIGNQAFSQCAHLTKINFASNSSLTNIGENAFWNIGIEELMLPSGLLVIGDYAFTGCSNLRTLVIPTSVTFVGAYSFSNCTALTTVVIPDTDIHYGTFDGCLKVAVVFYGGTEQQWTELHWGVNDIGIDYEVPYIEYESDVTSLTRVNTTVSSMTYGLSYLLTNTNLVLELKITGKKVVPAGYVDLATLIDGKTVISLAREAFADTYSVASFWIPTSVVVIGENAFLHCNAVIYCKADSKPDAWNTNWNYSNCQVVWGCEDPVNETINGMNIDHKVIQSTSIDLPSNVVIPEGVLGIASNAFANKNSVTSITLPSTLLVIGEGAFMNMTFASIIIPTSVKTIGPMAFFGCSALTSIYIPNNVNHVLDYAFQNCSALTINCQASSKPSGWADTWNPSNRPVNWAVEP